MARWGMRDCTCRAKNLSFYQNSPLVLQGRAPSALQVGIRHHLVGVRRLALAALTAARRAAAPLCPHRGRLVEMAWRTRALERDGSQASTRFQGWLHVRSYFGRESCLLISMGDITKIVDAEERRVVLGDSSRVGKVHPNCAVGSRKDMRLRRDSNAADRCSCRQAARHRMTQFRCSSLPRGQSHFVSDAQ